MRKSIKSALAILTTLALSITLVGCSDVVEDTDNKVSDSEELDDITVEEASVDLTNKSMVMTLSADNKLQITRVNEGKNTPMGDDDTWTIFVYMCGSDLESGSGMATMDIQEMMAASISDNVKFVVETGGANSWEIGADAELNQRFVITNGEIGLVDEKSQAAMGKSKTLESFLSWGIENYPAANMGLVFWNHGGGSISGVCFDELNDYKSLSLRKIDAALLSISDMLTDKFEFIGCDACLMGTSETANVFASYANYMVCSQELEPGYGWDYTVIGDYLASNPGANGRELGEVIADSFYESCAACQSEDGATLSVIDLGNFDKLMVAFNDYAYELYNSSDDTDVLAKIKRKIKKVDNFGGNNKAEGYTNMVDLGGIIETTAKYSDASDMALTALNSTVCYKVSGSQHANASGLSIYYPLKIEGSKEIKTFNKIAISPYYLAFVDRMVESGYGITEYGNFDASGVVENWGSNEYDMEEILSDDGNDAAENTTEYDYVDEGKDDNSNLITFTEKPGFNENGNACFTLDESGLENTASVVASVAWVIDSDNEQIADLGEVADLSCDWETGYIEDNFDGLWYALTDGQYLGVYYVSSTDDYDVYTSKVRLNGEETNLRFRVYYEDGRCEFDGIWDGIDEYGMASGQVKKLNIGDTIVPLYYDALTFEEGDYYEGSEFVVSDYDFITYESLSDGEYWYGFIIDDIYDDFYISEYLTFNIEDGQIYYSED